MSLLQELNKCHLPIRITNGSNILNVTAYNNAAVLYVNKDGQENYMPMIYLNGFNIYEGTEQVTLYKYSYFDTGKQKMFTSPWTTQTWVTYLVKLTGKLELKTTRKKVLEL